MQIDPRRDIIVVSVHAHNALYAIDPADPGREMVRLASAGSKPALHPYAAVQYAPNLDRLVYFSPVDSGIVYTIEAPQAEGSRGKFVEPWTWRACAPVAGTLDPISDAAAHSRFPVNRSQTFGRFRIASFGALDIAVLVRHVDSPVYAMKLA
jgi:hypothetical protein